MSNFYIVQKNGMSAIWQVDPQGISTGRLPSSNGGRRRNGPHAPSRCGRLLRTVASCCP
jgi:hypothetical protein